MRATVRTSKKINPGHLGRMFPEAGFSVQHDADHLPERAGDRVTITAENLSQPEAEAIIQAYNFDPLGHLPAHRRLLVELRDKTERVARGEDSFSDEERDQLLAVIALHLGPSVDPSLPELEE